LPRFFAAWLLLKNGVGLREAEGLYNGILFA